MPRNNGPGPAAARQDTRRVPGSGGLPAADLTGLTRDCGRGGVAITGSLA